MTSGDLPSLLALQDGCSHHWSKLCIDVFLGYVIFQLQGLFAQVGSAAIIRSHASIPCTCTALAVNVLHISMHLATAHLATFPGVTVLAELSGG